VSGCGCGGAKCRLEVGDPRHGRHSGYTHGKCRCGRCSQANHEYKARYRAENSEKKRKSDASYRAKNAEKVREGKALYYVENLEKERARNARYRTTPRGKAVQRACKIRRRDRELSRCCGCYTAKNLDLVWALDDGLCAYCGDPGTTVDHIVPLRPFHASTDGVGGWGCINNFRLACRRCNSGKKNRPLADFLDRLESKGTPIRPGATNSGLPCPAAAERMSRRMLTASPTSLN
jgi:5-methylcytosine-specific restriction endonuclease McrA